jgi:hypothetical protein
MGIRTSLRRSRIRLLPRGRRNGSHPSTRGNEEVKEVKEVEEVKEVKEVQETKEEARRL